MTLRDAWDANADAWVRWAREPGHDSYWQFHRRHFLEVIPPARRLTLDVGCGEGRVSRDLMTLGHRVIALDGSSTMARACATHHPSPPVAVADAAELPVRSEVADLVVAFMVLQDVDDLPGATGEIARVLTAGGRLCLAIVHPINSAGVFAGERSDADAPFMIEGSYLDSFDYVDDIERDGLTMTFHSAHRPIETYSRALEDAGFVIECFARSPTTTRPIAGIGSHCSCTSGHAVSEGGACAPRLTSRYECSWPVESAHLLWSPTTRERPSRSMMDLGHGRSRADFANRRSRRHMWPSAEQIADSSALAMVSVQPV